MYGEEAKVNVGREGLDPMQDYRSLCAAVAICSTLVNTHTHTCRHTDRQILTACNISSASRGKTATTQSICIVIVFRAQHNKQIKLRPTAEQSYHFSSGF